MSKFEYTTEMALFEIWGALQISTGYSNDIKDLAEACMKRAGLLGEQEERRDDDVSGAAGH